MLSDAQVLQRTSADGVSLSGLPTGTQVRTIAGTVVAQARADDAELSVPVGGPYDVFDAAGTRIAARILVGDVWVLAGQSNMQGSAPRAEAEEPSWRVHVFDMKKQWRLAEEPLHQLFQSPDRAHYLDDDLRDALAAIEASSAIGTGPGLSFAKHLAAETGMPIGLVATAHGGTLISQWDPKLRDQGTDSLYGSMLDSIQRAGGRVAGVLWYQGESDAQQPFVEDYAEKLPAFIEAVRDDVDAPDLPFLFVQIGRVLPLPEVDADAWSRLREIQRSVPGQLAHVAMTSAVDLPLCDIIHVSASGAKRVGRRLARLAAGHAPLTVGDVHVERGPLVNENEDFAPTLIRVRFDGVHGSLAPGDGITGFSVLDADGNDTNAVYGGRVFADRPDEVVIGYWGAVEPGATLWYGRGCFPICNLVDEADSPVPAFGPVALDAATVRA